jgi:hypothetical protein
MWQVEALSISADSGKYYPEQKSAVSFTYSFLDQNSGHENRDMDFFRDKGIILKIKIRCNFIFADQLFDSKSKTNFNNVTPVRFRTRHLFLGVL